MAELVQFMESPSIFHSIALFYKDEYQKVHIGFTYFYDGRGVADDWLSILYKDPLPDKAESVIMGWNWLDDNSAQIYLIPTDKPETGIEDFLYGNGLEKDWKSISYVAVKSYPEIEEYLQEHPLETCTAIAFGMK